VLDMGFAFAAETGERLYEPELWRLKGESLLCGDTTRSRKADAAAYFKRAIAKAAELQALLFELRATTSLCRISGKPARERGIEPNSRMRWKAAAFMLLLLDTPSTPPRDGT
jgi:hypothetical protein